MRGQSRAPSNQRLERAEVTSHFFRAYRPPAAQPPVVRQRGTPFEPPRLRSRGGVCGSYMTMVYAHRGGAGGADRGP